jgi:hypothetical protein
MNILIANLGVSDLSVQIGEFFFPVDNRQEPNLNSSENEFWNCRRELLREFAETEFGFYIPENGNSYFRALTKYLLDEYRKAPEVWFDRIRHGRIEGVIHHAHKEFNACRVYLVVTDQSTPDQLNHHPNDTVYLFDLLKLRFSVTLPNVELIKLTIPKSIHPTDQDRLLDYYYARLRTCSGDGWLLVSNKGGTPQMQNALRVQALTSGISKTLFIESELSIEDVLSGQLSECRFTSYWRFTNNFRIQAVKRLLDRWDFDGARVLVQDWQNTLEEMCRYCAIPEERSFNLISKTLSCVCMLLCLDHSQAKRCIEANPDLKKNKSFKKISNGDFDKILDIYSQCKIQQKRGGIPEFLWRMSSFYEAILNELIDNLLKKIALRGVVDSSPSGYFLLPKKAPQPLLSVFEKSEDLRLHEDKKYKLESRPTKINFVEAFIEYDRHSGNRLFAVASEWEKLKSLLQKLDYWARQRNQLIHNVKGLSYESMNELLWKDRKSSDNRNKYELQMLKDACDSADILDVMWESYQTYKKCLKPSAGKNTTRDNEFYIYSEIRDWIIEQIEASRRDSAETEAL